MHAHRKWTVLFTLALLPLAACAGEDDMDEEGMEEAPATEPAEMGSTDVGSEPMTIQLAAKNESGVTGEATATHHMDSVSIDVSVSGASGDGEYPAHIHQGTCEGGGGVLAPLNSIQVTGGSGNSSTTLAASELGEDQDAFVQVHDTEGQPVACGDLRGHGDMEGME